MTDISLPAGNSVYQEDVSTLAAGTELIGQSAVVWNVAVTLESSSVAVVSFSNSISSYDSSSRNMKVVVDGPGTHSIAFPKGKYCSTGLSVVSNVASVDVAVDYD